MLKLVNIEVKGIALAVTMNKLLKDNHIPYNTDHGELFKYVALVDGFQYDMLKYLVKDNFNEYERIWNLDITEQEV